MGVVDRLQTLCEAEQQEQARDLATGVIQNDTVVDVELSGEPVDADGTTVVHVETEHFHGRHVLSDRSERGTGWPGRYTVTGTNSDVGFDFRTATMPSEAERRLEDHYDVPKRRTDLPDWGHSESDSEVNADD